MSSDKYDVKKQIERNTVLLAEQEEKKRKHKLLVRFSPVNKMTPIPKPTPLVDLVDLQFVNFNTDDAAKTPKAQRNK